MDDGAVLPTRHKLDVATLYRMADAGIFTEDDRVELIDGELIDMAPIGYDHAATVNVINRTLVLACGERAVVSVQNPVGVDDYTEPQPDFVVLRPRADDYRSAPRAGSGDALLVIEVADTSLRYDRTVKLPLYARAGFAEVWIVDLRHRVVTSYAEPAGEEYVTVQTYRQDDTIVLRQAPDIAVALAGVFG